MAFISKYAGLEIENYLDEMGELLSGNNTKTINGESIIGEGDITISSSQLNNDANFISKDIADETYASKENVENVEESIGNLSNELSSKQETLVSGVNIKTVNGESIIGSGNITIAGEGDIIAGEFNVQSNWNETNLESDAFILNKPESLKNPYSLKFGNKVYDGSSEQTITASDLVVSGDLSGLTERIETLEEFHSITKDSDTIINKWNDVVDFLGGMSDESTLQGVLSAKANTTALNATNSEVMSLDLRIDTLEGYFSNGSAKSANSVAWTNVSGKPTFATVATSGSYNDLSNKPTIPSLSGYATQQWVKDQNYKTTDNNTTYTFGSGTNGFTVTPSGGSTQTITVTPSISVASTSANGLMSSTMVSNLNNVVSKLPTIEENASNGNTAYGWGDHNGKYLSIEGGECSGNITATGFYQSSDESLKDFKDDIVVDFEKLKTIPKKYFTWKNNAELNIGTGAQSLGNIYPELVTEVDGKLRVDYSKLSVIALAAIDKLYEENLELKSRMDKLEKLILNGR